jgi:hypothetical protein
MFSKLNIGDMYFHFSSFCQVCGEPNTYLCKVFFFFTWPIITKSFGECTLLWFMKSRLILGLWMEKFGS